MISFWLDPDNPRKTQAREVLNAWVEKGFSVRYILTEALLKLNSSKTKDQMTNVVEIAESMERLSMVAVFTWVIFAFTRMAVRNWKLLAARNFTLILLIMPGLDFPICQHGRTGQ